MPFKGVALTGSRVADHVVTAVLAEQLGYESGWVTEVQGPDAVSVLTACAGATTTLKLSTGIVSTYTRSPFLAAMTFASLAEYSGGRVSAGFGTSTPAIVEGWHGLGFAKPLATTREYVDLFRRLVAGERVKSTGRFNIRGASLRGPSAHPIPVYIAALNDGMLALAAEVADGVVLNFPTLNYTRHAISVLENGLQKAGRERASFEIVANFRTGIGDFDPIANMLRRELITYFLAPVYQRVFTSDGYGSDIEAVGKIWAGGQRPEAIAAIPDAFVDAHSIIGSRSACASRVEEFLARGIDSAVLFPVASEGPALRERQADVIRELALPR